MKLALHGYGKMGKAVEKIAKESGHEVVAIYTSSKKPGLNGAEVMIDFSQGPGVDEAVALACDNRINLVIGTTGWNDRLDAFRQRIEKAGVGCAYASNFSQERHHAQKKDAPSGTALRIATEVKQGSGAKLDPPIVSTRVGAEFGFHNLFFDSADDLIEISHRARGREGFARGAILAAEKIKGRKGLIRFDELVMS